MVTAKKGVHVGPEIAHEQSDAPHCPGEKTAAMTVPADIIAPWIWDSYREAAERFVVDLPVLTGDPLEQALAVALTSLAMFVVLWGGVSALPRQARILARLLGALPLLAPVLVLAVLLDMRLAPSSDQQNAAAMPDTTAGPVTPPSPDASTVPAMARPARSESLSHPAGSDPARESPRASSGTTEVVPHASAPAEAVPPELARSASASSSGASPATSSERPPDGKMGDAPVPPASLPRQEAAEGLSATPAPRMAMIEPQPASPPQATLKRNELEPEAPQSPSSPAATSSPASRIVLFATDRAPESTGEGAHGYGAKPFGKISIGQAEIARAGSKPASTPVAGKKEAARVEKITVGSEKDFAATALRQLLTSSRFPEQALVVVHGFDTSFEEALRIGGGFADDLGFDGPVMVYSWPSVGGPRGYRSDKAVAESSGEHLAEALKLLADTIRPKALHIAAAGLGARTALGAVRRLSTAKQAAASAASQSATANVGHLLLIAPDMERAVLSAAAAAVRPTLAGITLYASANDRALNVTRRHAGATPRAGDVSESGPLVTTSIETIDVSPPVGDFASDTDLAAVTLTGERSGSAATAEPKPGLIAAHASALLQGDAAKAAAAANLKRIETPAGPYWARR